jgi:hypothetical protein
MQSQGQEKLPVSNELDCKMVKPYDQKSRTINTPGFKPLNRKEQTPQRYLRPIRQTTEQNDKLP